MKIVFSSYAKRQWRKFSPEVKNSIRSKVKEMKESSILFKKNIKKVLALEPVTHRLRVGNYRMLLMYDDEIQGYRVLKIGHRREIYQ